MFKIVVNKTTSFFYAVKINHRIKKKCYKFLRIINIKDPVETHIDAEWNVDQREVLMFEKIVDCGEKTYHLEDANVFAMEVMLKERLHDRV